MISTSAVRRPATVTAAAALLTTTALGYVISALALFGQVGRTRRGAGELLDPIGLDSGGLLVFLQSAVVLTGVLTIVAALVLLGAAAGLRAGRPAARIVAWTTMGVLLLCGISGVTRGGSPEFSSNVQITMSRSDGARTEAVVEALPTLYADAYRIGSGIFAALAMIALITAAVLLTRPSANRWFGPPRAAAGPPPGYHPAPPAPPAPPTPGVPPTPGGPPRPSAAAQAELATLTRRHQRGELSDAEFAAARSRLTGA
ncbi:hypothetical protein GCM10020358_39520 [Amorphoplanes nipponensis]|uniref:Short C-terminal domain-containing protein n=1 Tax=Actinoplanes nipponensis TaxID=135950 RepID=A0A919JKH6_9ACTN|nr:SHOCT domain-containing protein [Actinoplanes nipponensis]GIE51010.1 hypothetical protein Ani05nite_45440 [Actinoplanes nipponensis]